MSTTQTMKNVGFTVPPAMAEEIEQKARKERRTKSEFFRHMFTLYRTYRKQLERAEEERFERIIDEAIAEGLREKEHPTMTDEEVEKTERELMRYGAEQGRKSGIDVEDNEAINRLIRNVRARQREKHRA